MPRFFRYPCRGLHERRGKFNAIIRARCSRNEPRFAARRLPSASPVCTRSDAVVTTGRMLLTTGIESRFNTARRNLRGPARFHAAPSRDDLDSTFRARPGIRVIYDCLSNRVDRHELRQQRFSVYFKPFPSVFVKSTRREVVGGIVIRSQVWCLKQRSNPTKNETGDRATHQSRK